MKSSRTILSSLSLLLIMASCSSSRDCASYQVEDAPDVTSIIHLTSDKPVLYQAKFSVLKYTFSGLIAFRNMTEESELRIAFISEMGLKLMEFSYQNNKVTNTYCMPAIYKKARMKFVGQFLNLILHQPQCTELCQVEKFPNSTYFCKAGGEKISLLYEEGLKKEMELQQSKIKIAKSHYDLDVNLPDTIWVDMKYKTRIQMTMLNNAFK